MNKILNWIVILLSPPTILIQIWFIWKGTDVEYWTFLLIISIFAFGISLIDEFLNE